MRSKGMKKIAAAALVAAAVAAAQAGDALRLQASGTSSLQIEGTSTLHDWKVQSGKISGFVEIAPEFLRDATLASVAALHEGGKPPVVRVSIPVKELRSGEARMDRVMLEALKADKHPEIRYELDRAVLAAGTAPASGPFGLETRGKLTVAGATREVKMPVTVTRSSNGEVTVKGKLPLKMTEFGIDPPRALMGTIRSGDAVTVSFEWRTRPAAATGGR
jgi:hypothetical protein